MKMIIFAAFFIWINYFWSIASPMFDKNGFVYKIFMMLTFSKYANVDQQDTEGINSKFEYLIILV
jgi:hypothetical protein